MGTITIIKTLVLVVPPQAPTIYTSGRILAKNVQAFDEGSPLALLCEVMGGEPPPRVTWHWDDRLLDETFIRDDDVTVNRLDMNRVTRNLLNAKLVCKANNTHLMQPITADIIIDVNRKSQNYRSMYFCYFLFIAFFF